VSGINVGIGGGSTIWRVEPFTAPAAESATAVHAAVASSQPNAYPGPITQPTPPRVVHCAFSATWDGGDLTVVGTDQFNAPIADVIADAPASTVAGVKIFKTVTSITKQSVGLLGFASVGVGNKLGLNFHPSSALGVLSVDGTSEAVAIDATYPAFAPTANPPNGVRSFIVAYPSLD